MNKPDYRPFIPSPTQSKIAGATARAHAEARLKSPRAQELFGGWNGLLGAPFTGITTDGQVIAGLYALRPEGAPTAAMVEAGAAQPRQLSPSPVGWACFPQGSGRCACWGEPRLS